MKTDYEKSQGQGQQARLRVRPLPSREQGPWCVGSTPDIALPGPHPHQVSGNTHTHTSHTASSL